MAGSPLVAPGNFNVSWSHVRTAPRLTPVRNDVPVSKNDAVEINSACVLTESAALDVYFQNDLRQANEVGG